MKRLLGSLVLILAACSADEEVNHQASVNVDLSTLPALLAAVDGVAENALDVPGLLAMSESVSLDQEKQQIVPVTFGGRQTELMIHVWREHADWVHLYFQTPSADLIAALKTATARLARPDHG